MKTLKSIIFYLICTPLIVLAKPIISYDSLWEYDVEGVYQGTDGTTFASNMPPANIFINPNISKINDYETKIITDEKGFISCDYNFDEHIGNRRGICYNGSIPGATQLHNDSVNTFSGDLFYYEYPRIATLKNGDKANVRFTFSNLRLVTDYDATNINESNILISAGNIITQIKEEKFTTAYKMDIKIQIVDENGTPIKDGVFIYGMTDIDILRRVVYSGEVPPKQYPEYYGSNTVNSLKKIYDPSGNAEVENYYSESVLVRSGQIGDLYIPGGTEDDPNEEQKGYKCYITKDENGIRFNPSVSDKYVSKEQGIDGTFYSGFVAAIDNNIGLNITIWNAGRGKDQVFKTFLLSYQPHIYSIKTTSDNGGLIYTKIENNNGKEYVESNDMTFIVNEGGKINFKFAPRERYKLKDVYLSDNSTDYKNGWTNNNKVIASKVDFNEGYYYVTFSSVQSDASIHIEWEKEDVEDDELENNMTEEKSMDNPNTIDSILTFVVLSIISVLLLILLKINRTKMINK